MASTESAALADYKGFRLAEEDRNPGDIEVPLQTITVQLPEEPLLVNGSPYGFEVDGERLGQAINIARRTFWRPGQFEPLSLQVSLGESLPEKIAGDNKAEEEKIFDYNKKVLKVVVPSEVGKSNMPETLLATQVEDALNRDLVTGIAQIRQEKRVVGHRLFLYGGSMAVGSAIGEGVGIATGSSSIEAMVGRGTAGALIMSALVTGVASAKIIYTDWRLGKIGLDTVEHKSQRRVEKKGVGKDLQSLFEEPAIRLVPASTTTET